MIIKYCEQRSDEWHEERQGKITGTALKALTGTQKARDTLFYEILAERLSIEANSTEKPLDRGIRLEDEAITQFEIKTGKIVEKVGICYRKDNERIANSPDGLISKNGKYTEAPEVKCPDSKNHLKIWLENKVPEEYIPQTRQYFIVNDELETLYFISYDPRITIHPLHIIEIHRIDIAEEIEDLKQRQIDFLDEVNKKVEELLNFNEI